MDFKKEEIGIRPLYLNECLNDYVPAFTKVAKIKDVLGFELRLPELRKDRPFLYASYVESMDGKLAYADIPDAFYIAQKNQMSGHGKTTDFWILNMLRYISDACLIGGNTLQIDPHYLMTNVDQELDGREDPIQIITTLDGSNLPFEHQLLWQRKLPRLLITSEEGWQRLSSQLKQRVKRVQAWTKEVLMEESLAVLVTGQGRYPDTKEVMTILKQQGIDRLLIESPGYGHHLIEEGLLDEIFFNFSCVYVAGKDAMTMGKHAKGFSAENHPHARILSLAMYNDFYLYFRYKMEYGHD